MKRFMTLGLLLLITFSLFGDSVVIRNSSIPGIPLQKANVKKAESNSIGTKLVPSKTNTTKQIDYLSKITNKINYISSQTQSKSVIDTLTYWDTNASNYFYHNQPDNYDDYNYTVRFTPINNGSLVGTSFWWYNLVGSGTIVVHIWDNNSGYPGNELGSLNINSSTIDTSGLNTYIDLSSLGISVNTSSDFYIGYSISNIDTLGLLFDTTGFAPSRCYDYWPSSGWETSDWIHSNMTWLIDAYIDNGSSAGPNLTFYTPSGWDGPIVASSVSGTNTNGPNLTADSTTYIDWAVINNGTVDITDTFYTYLYSDGVAIGGWYVDTLQAGYYISVQDYEHTFAEGTHTVSITTDSTNAITETNETDNHYSHDFTWTSGGGTGYQGNAEYIIITPSSFVNAFQPLAWWKSKKGIYTSIVTTDSIYNNWSGYDNAEKIRNFIKEAKDSGAIYILLGGQADYENGEEYVARRNVYCMTSGVGHPSYPDEDTIPCDMYYANLDGTWDSDGDHIYGEMSDGVDLYADIYVGRAPVKDTSQIADFISKIMAYENNPNPGYIRKIYLPQGNLWTGNSGRGINDTIYAEIPTSWQRSKQYEDIQGITRNIVNDSMDSGFNLQHWVGHGNEDGIYYNGGYTVYYNYTDPLTNTNDSTRTSIINSIGCFTGALDEVPGGDCLAERMVNSNKNACVATMMNTRYGWGYSSPEGALGPSAEITVAFYRNLFNTSAYHLGEVLANALDDIASAANSSSYYRWSVYEHMLFGDPEMPIWTDIPQNFTVVVSPDTAIQSQDNTITVTVTDGAKASVSGALVTFAQDDFQVYEKELTSASGVATVTINPPGIGDTIYITVTKENFIPYETYILSVKGTAGIKQKTLNNELLKIRSNRNTIDIQFSLNKTSNVKFDIIDISGRMIKRIDKQFTAGKNTLSISSKDMARGIYFVKLNGNDFSKTKKIAIIR